MSTVIGRLCRNSASLLPPSAANCVTGGIIVQIRHQSSAINAPGARLSAPSRRPSREARRPARPFACSPARLQQHRLYVARWAAPWLPGLQPPAPPPSFLHVEPMLPLQLLKPSRERLV